MASDTLTVQVAQRTALGTAATRRLRRLDNQIPGVVYGAQQTVQHIMMDGHLGRKLIDDTRFFSQLIDLNVDGKVETVVLKDWQAHPIRAELTHVDFMRISQKDPIVMTVSITFEGMDVAPGVEGNGQFEHLMDEVAVRCLPKDLPATLLVDVSKMALNQVLHLSDVVLPNGVELASAIDDDHNPPVLSLQVPHIATEEEENAAAAEAAAATAEAEAAAKAKESGDAGQAKKDDNS